MLAKKVQIAWAKSHKTDRSRVYALSDDHPVELQNVVGFIESVSHGKSPSAFITAAEVDNECIEAGARTKSTRVDNFVDLGSEVNVQQRALYLREQI
jgi:hypothetical protein